MRGYKDEGFTFLSIINITTPVTIMIPSFTSSCISLLLAASSIATLVSAHHLSGSLKQFEYNNDADAGVETTDNKVFYLAPGMSYCNVTYRDESEVACVNKYWLDEKNSCQRFVKITNPLTGVTAQAQVLDKCGDVVNSSEWRMLKGLATI